MGFEHKIHCPSCMFIPNNMKSFYAKVLRYCLVVTEVAIAFSHLISASSSHFNSSSTYSTNSGYPYILVLHFWLHFATPLWKMCIQMAPIEKWSNAKFEFSASCYRGKFVLKIRTKNSIQFSILCIYTRWRNTQIYA